MKPLLLETRMAKTPRKTSKSPTAKTEDDFPDFKDGREFDALSYADKEKVWNYYNRKIPLSETREPTTAERALIARMRKKAGRPKVGQGSKLVAVTIEKGLLNRVDAYAKEHAMKRAELIARGLRLVLGEARVEVRS
jgi:hypothetical protein